MFVNCNWVAARWQQYSTHLHTNNTHTTTQNQQYTEQHKNFGKVRAVPHLCGFLSWHLTYNWGKSTEKPQSGQPKSASWYIKVHCRLVRRPATGFYALPYSFSERFFLLKIHINVIHSSRPKHPKGIWEGVGYVKTQLSCILLYYADDDMFRPLWAIFRSQKCI